MKREALIAIAVIAVVLLIVLPWLRAGIYLGSRTEPIEFVERGSREVSETALVCRYYKLVSGVSEDIYLRSPKREVHLPRAGGSLLINPDHMGVTDCPVMGFWSWYVDLWR
jgi:hypothetical protein